MPYYSPRQNRQIIKRRFIRWLRELNLVPTNFRDHDLRPRVINIDDTELDSETTLAPVERTTTSKA